ncbi:MAG: hypothetical protein WAU70_02625 [Flavobacteriales bacterium]
MTANQISLINTTWALLRTRGTQFAEMCYDELFAREPLMRIVFSGFVAAR